MKTIKATYFFGRSHLVGARIATVVEQAIQTHFPSCTVSIIQDAYTADGQPLYTMRTSADKLSNTLIHDVTMFTTGAIAIAKVMVK